MANPFGGESLTGLFGGLAAGIDSNREYELKKMQVQQQIDDKKAAAKEKEREYFAKWTEELSQAMLEPDNNIRQTAVNALISSAEDYRGKPIGKEFKSWITKQPDQALEFINEINKRGVDPKIILDVANQPMLLAHGLLALGKANRERQARAERGDGGGSAPADTSPSNTQGTPGGSGFNLGGVTQSQPFGAQPAAPVAATAPQAGTSVAPQGDDTEVAQVRQRVLGLTSKINNLASMGRPEAEITPFRQERQRLEDVLMKPGLERRTEVAKQGVQPVSVQDVQRGVQSAQRAGRPDLAQRFIPGMRREAYDALLGQLGTTQTEASTPAAPGASMASPMIGGAAPAQPLPSGSPAGRGISLVPSPEEELRTTHQITRQETPIPADLRRDPNMRGVNTLGDLERSGRNPRTKEEEQRAVELAAGGAKQTLGDFEAVKADGLSARRRSRYLDILAGAAENAGPRGPWLSPIRETVNNLANLLAIKDPAGQSNMQLMNAISNKLIPELTMQFKGSQSDREFLAGLASAPNYLQSERGFAVLLHSMRELDKINLEADFQARQWVKKYGALDVPDQNGETFQEAFDHAIVEFDRLNGSLQERVAKSMKMKPSQLLKMK